MNNEDCTDDSEDLYGIELVEACEIKREKKYGRKFPAHQSQETD